MSTIFFQPPGIDKKYCEVGMILKSDPDYVHYVDEPCKIPINEIKIIDEENVIFNRKTRMYRVKEAT